MKGKARLERLARHWDDAKMDVLLLAQSKAKAIGHDKGEDHLFIKRDNTFDWNEPEAPYIIAGHWDHSSRVSCLMLPTENSPSKSSGIRHSLKTVSSACRITANGSKPAPSRTSKPPKKI